MSTLTLIQILASLMLAVGLLAVIAWFARTAYLDRLERRLGRRKGVYHGLVSELATRERALLEPEIRRLATLLDLEALEAALEEQAWATTDRPAWLLDVHDRLGLVDRYIEKLRSGRQWRERAFAAELLGRVGNAKAVPALLETIQATRTEDGDVREIALRALARIADPRAVETLVEALQTAEAWLAPRIADALARHGSDAVEPLIALLAQPTRHPARAWAANVLGEVKSPRVVPALLRALDDPQDEVRAKAATALGRLGDPRAVPHLLERLLGDPAPFVRARIARVLGQFDDAEVIDHLVRSLGDAAWWVRMRSIEALEQIGARAEGPLTAALDDPDPEIRLRAAVGLERLGVPARLVGRLERGETVCDATKALARIAGAGARELLVELLLHSSAGVRGAAVLAVRRAGRRDLTPELVEIAERDPDGDLRAAASDALAAAAGEAGPTALARGLRGALDEGERTRLIGPIRALDGEGDRRDLLEVIRGDPSAKARAAALTAVGRLLDADELLSVARQGLGDPSLLVRRAAVELFAGVTPERAFPTLLETVRADDDPAVLASVAELAEAAFPAFADLALGMSCDGPYGLLVAHIARYVHHPDLPGLLPAMARSDSPEVREAIAAVWRHRPDTLSGPALDALVADPVSAVRKEAAGAAAHLGRWDLLERMAVDPDPDVRREVALALSHGANGNGARPDPSARETLERLTEDPAMAVRAAAYVGRLLQGSPVPFPPGLDHRSAADALGAGHLPALRRTARGAPSDECRLAAALALALLEDDVARLVARTDPTPAVRHRVSGALDLAAQGRVSE